MKEIIRYEVFDKKNRWMGGYSTKLDEMYDTDSYVMARINASQCDGKVFAVKVVGEGSEVSKEVKIHK